MKKYILYDDKVYEIKVNEKYKREGAANYYYIQTSPHTRLLLEEDDVKQCKQANSIEELCEEFVMVNNSCFTKPLIIDFTELDMYEGETIYGATWNDKGLIYVAKLNDKGELELI